MGYVRATEVLPDDIIRLIQTYVEGELIYIPKQNKKRWGTNTETLNVFLHAKSNDDIMNIERKLWTTPTQREYEMRNIMMKMLLVSMFQNVSILLKKIEPDLRHKTVTYIPTASVVEKLGFFVKIGKWKLRKLGLVVEELDVSTSSYDTIVNTLTKNDIIFIAGGNTFYLLQELRKSGADKILTQEVKKGKLFIGESAGAIVMAPDIAYSTVMDCVEKAPDLKDYVGLGLIDFYVVPHYNNWEMGKAAQKIIDVYSDSLDLKVISDNQAILVEEYSSKVLNV